MLNSFKQIKFSGRLSAISAMLLILMTGCTRPDAGPEKITAKKIVAIAAVEPHAFLLERIGKERVQVDVLIPAGKEPETYQVTPEKLTLFSNADLFFRTGMLIEETLLPKLQTLSESLQIIDLRTGIELRNLEIHDHGHSESHESPYPQTDPHIWFAPALLKTESVSVLRALQQRDPSGTEIYQKNYEELLQEIETVRLDIAAMLSAKRGEVVFVFHPSYGYFCEEFGLEQWAIEYEGKSPKPRQIAELIEKAGQLSGTPKIFVQPEFSRSAAQSLAESIGTEVVVHSALERDVLQSLRRFAQRIAEP